MNLNLLPVKVSIVKLTILVACFASLQGSLIAQQENQSIQLRPDSGNIMRGSTFTIYFLEAIVKPETIGGSNGPIPLIFEPKVEYDFLWKSQTEAAFKVIGPLMPGQSYKVRLVPGLENLDGKPVNRKQWIDHSFEAPQLTVNTRFRGTRSSLPQRPRVSLMFNYKILFSSAPEAIYFQDHESRERFRCDVFLPPINSNPVNKEPPAPTTGSSLIAQPIQSLPVNRKIDLVIDGLKDAATGTLLPYIKVFPLGKTAALSLQASNKSNTQNDALSSPEIVLNFNQDVDGTSVNSSNIKVEPLVKGLKRIASGASVRLLGEFDPTGKYKIDIRPSLRGSSGYSLSKAITETVQFKGIAPSIYFPSTMYFTRSRLGLKMKFLHANTGKTTWRLAKLPEHKIGVARNRLFQTGELLIEQLTLNEIAKGNFPAAPETKSIYRDLDWKPADNFPVPNGAYLLEISAPTKLGKLVANRSLIFFTDIFVTQKQTGTELLAKVQTMSESNPIAGVRTRLVSHDNIVKASSVTDNDGICRFNRSFLMRKNMPRASHLLIDSPGGGYAVSLVNGQTFYNSGWANSEPQKRAIVGFIFSDRNLYRPGSSAKFKGIVRFRENGTLENAPKQIISWKISEGYRGKVVASGETKTDDFGGWEAEWTISKDAKLGSYRLSAGDHGNAFIQVEEYRVPLFEVDITNKSDLDGSTARLQIQSNYFHGSPNSGAVARWSIDWYEPYIATGTARTNDQYSDQPLPKPFLKSSGGELRLNKNGSGIIEIKIPEAAPLSRPRYGFNIGFDVISPEGRSISNSLSGHLQPYDQILGIDLSPSYKNQKPSLELQFITLGPNNKPVTGKEVTAQVYRVESRTVKEQMSAGVYRYRNFNEHIKVASFVKTLPLDKDSALRVDVAGIPGRYVAVASLKGNYPRCSDSVYLAGEARARYPVHGRDGFGISTDKKTYEPGDIASLALEAPFGGKAWISIETDRVMEQFVVNLKHNASRIEVPIKPEYFPNAYATVYLVRAGGKDRLPAERFGRVQLKVNRKDLVLDVNPIMGQSQLEPGNRGTGFVSVMNKGLPVEGADVTVMAVDEAVLRLGNWELPRMFDRFYPSRSHNVATFRALNNHIEGFLEEDVTEKGFLIGGGGASHDAQKKTPRQNFLARALWVTGLQTDKDGKAQFEFEAPDNLTSFRVTAIAQTTDHRFGNGDSSFQVNKGLMIEPSLPRFVRNGDEIILRAIARQKVMDNAQVLINCKPSVGIDILENTQAELGPLGHNIPGTFNLKAKVREGISQAKIRFSATILGHSEIADDVEITLPVLRPGIMQKTGAYGRIPDDTTHFILSKAAPKFWQQSDGGFDLTLSRSPFVPKLQGLPELLEYPHGCFEQRTSRLLGYVQLADLIQFLPELGDRHKTYRATIEGGLKYLMRHVTQKGFLPYWTGSPKPNTHVTIQAAWVAHECELLDYEVPSELSEKLNQALDSIIQGRTKDHGDTRTFAAFVDSKFRKKNKPLNAIEELYLNRDQLRDESRAFLALAMHQYEVMPDESRLLAREISDLSPKKAFDPETFYSTSRANAVIYIAQSKIANPEWNRETEPKFRDSLLSIMDDSLNLSTQENLWLLMAVREMMATDGYKIFDQKTINSDFTSANKFSVAWKKQALSEINKIRIHIDQNPTYFLANASVMRDATNSKREDRGLRIERVVKNLTNPDRTGTPENPLTLGDEILITYRLQSDRTHHYVAVVDELASPLEVVNFNLAQVAEFYRLPQNADSNTLRLDHSELRDSSVNLYFNRLVKGAHTYSLLARVTCAGQFTWPSCNVTPMYEPRFGGLGNSSTVFVRPK